MKNRTLLVMAALSSGCSWGAGEVGPFTAADLPDDLYLLPINAPVVSAEIEGCEVTSPAGSRLVGLTQTVALLSLEENVLQLPVEEVVIAREPFDFDVDVAVSMSSRTLSRFAPDREAGALGIEPIRWGDLTFSPACGQLDVVNALDQDPFGSIFYLTEDVACRPTPNFGPEPDLESADDCIPRAEFDATLD